MIGKRLKEARLASGMTQVQLAEKMKVHPKIISCYELEIISPNESEKIELCRMLNISYDYLLGISNAAIPPVQDKRIIAIPDTVSNKDYEILRDTIQQLSTKKRISIHRVSEAISKQMKQLITDAIQRQHCVFRMPQL